MSPHDELYVEDRYVNNYTAYYNKGQYFISPDYNDFEFISKTEFTERNLFLRSTRDMKLMER